MVGPIDRSVQGRRRIRQPAEVADHRPGAVHAAHEIGQAATFVQGHRAGMDQAPVQGQPGVAGRRAGGPGHAADADHPSEEAILAMHHVRQLGGHGDHGLDEAVVGGDPGLGVARALAVAGGQPVIGEGFSLQEPLPLAAQAQGRAGAGPGVQPAQPRQNRRQGGLGPGPYARQMGAVVLGQGGAGFQGRGDQAALVADVLHGDEQIARNRDGGLDPLGRLPALIGIGRIGGADGQQDRGHEAEGGLENQADGKHPSHRSFPKGGIALQTR